MSFQPQQGSSAYELKMLIIAYMRPVQDQARQNPSKWGGGCQEIWPLDGEELLTVDSYWEGEKTVFWDVVPERLPTL